jgi:peptidoglycan/xylan/chitin deacetylase (PgdA/CDA1 family)
MLSGENHPLHFPDKTLSLTFDDGPGPNTLEIAQFLFDQGIQATFFVVGKHVRQRPDVVAKVAGLGHTIGNHTTSHSVMHRDMCNKPHLLIAEVLGVHQMVKDVVGDGPRFFRAPYGHWSPSVASILNRNNDIRRYFGPIGWEINQGDYEIGGRSAHDLATETYTVGSCLRRYVANAHMVRKGVILLHDWCADDGPKAAQLQRNNRTVELTKKLVARLIQDFTFIPLDYALSHGRPFASPGPSMTMN